MPCSLPQLSVVSVGVNRFSCVRLFMTLWIIARQAPLSMGFSRQEYWSGLSCPPPGNLPDPGIEPVSPALAGGFFITEPPGKPPVASVIPALESSVTQLCLTL